MCYFEDIYYFYKTPGRIVFTIALRKIKNRHLSSNQNFINSPNITTGNDSYAHTHPLDSIAICPTRSPLYINTTLPNMTIIYGDIETTFSLREFDLSTEKTIRLTCDWNLLKMAYFMHEQIVI